jgi:hypothetical protein
MLTSGFESSPVRRASRTSGRFSNSSVTCSDGVSPAGVDNRAGVRRAKAAKSGRIPRISKLMALAKWRGWCGKVRSPRSLESLLLVASDFASLYLPSPFRRDGQAPITQMGTGECIKTFGEEGLGLLLTFGTFWLCRRISGLEKSKRDTLRDYRSALDSASE